MSLRLHHVNSNLLDSTRMVLVNPVNCVGVAGAGLYDFRQDGNTHERG
jgi:hypothetical protein